MSEFRGIPIGVEVHIINKFSNRMLYATSDEEWDAGFGAGFPHSDVDGGVWRIVPAGGGCWRIIVPATCNQRESFAKSGGFDCATKTNLPLLISIG